MLNSSKIPSRRRSITVALTMVGALVVMAPLALASGAHDFRSACFGAKDSPRQAIFLHGILSVAGDATDVKYEPVVEKLANDLGMRIAMPRSSQLCKNSKTKSCWVGEDADQIATTYAAIVRSAARCIDTKRTFGLVGHSNGGYFVGKTFMRCLAPRPAWMIAAGSAGDIALAEGKSLSNCGRFTLFIGDKDITNAKAKAFTGKLRALKANVTFREYRGKHDLTYSSLRDVVKENMGKE